MNEITLYKKATDTVFNLLTIENNETILKDTITQVADLPVFKDKVDVETLLSEVNKRKNTVLFKAKSHVLSLLGDELIGSDSLAIFELVKNSYDADAQNVKIIFEDLNTENQKIVIEDDGCGMKRETIQDVWLTIGTDFKRGKNRKISDVFERVSFGNKGVGRLAVHKLAKKAKLETKHMDENSSSRVFIDWKKLIDSHDFIQELEVEIEQIDENLFESGSGTRITLSSLTSTKWSKKALKDLVRKIENIKNPFAYFPDFNVTISCNDYHQEWIDEIKSSTEILEDSLYQFEFEVKPSSKDLKEFAYFEWKYKFNPPKQIGINENYTEQKGENETSYFHIGELYKDEDDFHKYLKNFDLHNIGSFKGKFYVFNLNSDILKRRFGGQINGVKNYIKENCGVKIYRDDIRVYNYGESFDDWLSLDLDKIQRAGDHFGKKVTIGAVELDLHSSIEGLVEKTNREGFTDNITYQKFRLLVKEIFRFFEREAAIDKDKIDSYLESTKPIKKVGFGETIKELQDKLKEKDLEAELTPLLKRVNKDYDDMRDIMVNSGMTGLNLGVAFHEVEREIKYLNVDLKQDTIEIEEIKGRVKNLIQILDGLSPILKQNKNVSTNAKHIIERAKIINDNRFTFHEVVFSCPIITGENDSFNFKGPSGLLISSISNLIDNAIYWTTSKRELESDEYKPAIYIGSDIMSFDGPAIIVADNGPGFNVDPEYLIQPFKTNKEGGMGLGLYFADLVMNMLGGKLIFPDNLDLEIPQAYNGACIALVFPK